MHFIYGYIYNEVKCEHISYPLHLLPSLSGTESILQDWNCMAHEHRLWLQRSRKAIAGRVSHLLYSSIDFVD